MEMPTRYRLPPDMEEAMLIYELGFPPQVIDDMDQGTIERILIYKGVKNAAMYGGNWQP